MPRSFLVRKYFRRRNYLVNDDDFEDHETDIADSDCVSSQNKIRTECCHYEELDKKSNWNYEAEKCYWFEVSKKEHFLQVTDDEFIENWRIDKNEEDIETCCKEDKKIQESNKKGTEVIHKEDQKEELVLENIEEKLSHMLGENPDIIKKNIKQFLDNNRILIKEIAFETELNEESVTGYINGNENFSVAQRQDFYRWYLLKILRPPNGSDGKSFTCFKCGKIFAYKSYLERHVKYVCPDNTGRTWKCSYCSKAFQYPCYLRRHIRSHTGESPYKCDKCDRAFVRSTDLQRHIRNHTGEKPYKCSECDRAFARSTDLKRHMRTHTGEKPYKCWQCGKTFSQSGSLQTHLHTHNKDTVVGRKLSKGSK